MAILACLLLLHADKADPPVVGMVLRAGEGARLQRGKEPERPLRDMDLLRAGDVVLNGKAPASIVLLDDGHGERIGPNRKVTLEKAGCSPSSAVEKLKPKMTGANLKQLRK